MNLHNIVSGAIGMVNAHENVTIWRSDGVTNNKGIITPAYTSEQRRAQIQAPTASDLQMFERTATASHTIKVWIDAPASTINRVQKSAGDIIQRADGTFWQIVGIVHDYTPEGWLCCLAVLQNEPPEGVQNEPTE